MNQKWDERFMEMADLVATWSKDPSSKVGAVIVNRDRHVVGMGYNGFPPGIQDYEYLMEDKEAKLQRMVHAEANAILNCRPEPGLTLYVTRRPCNECTKLILATNRFERIVTRPMKMSGKWKDSCETALKLMFEAELVVTILGREK